MKKFLATLFLFATFAVQVQTANAMSYDEAIKQPKPMVLLIYADWAEGLDKVNQNFDNAQKQYGATYNFVNSSLGFLSILSKAKNFNKKYYFYPNLPYALLIRDGGKVSRYLQKDNINDASAFAERLKAFIN